MARAARIALDLTLVSLRTIKPVISSAWVVTKDAVGKTKARRVVINPAVTKVERLLDKISDVVISKLKGVRNSLLPREEQYLIKQLEIVRNKMKDGDSNATAKSLRPAVGTAWQYAKVELVPPMTIGFFNGPAGKSLENKASNLANGIITGLQSKIKDIDAAEERRKQEKKAAEENAKAKAKEDALKKQAADILAKEAAAKKQAATAKKPALAEKKNAAEAKKPAPGEKKKAAETSKATPAKKKKAPEAKKAAPDKKKAAPKPTSKKKPPKKNRRDEKKGSPPKAKK